MITILPCGCELDVQVNDKNDPKWNIEISGNIHFCRSHHHIEELLTSYKGKIDDLVIKSLIRNVGWKEPQKRRDEMPDARLDL